MFQLEVNYWAVLVSAIAHMIIGAAWYSPILFGKPWMKFMGFDKLSKADWKKQQKKAGPGYLVSAIGALIMAFVLAMFLPVLGATTIGTGILVALLFWIGFIATHTLTNAMFTQKAFGHWAIDSVYPLISMIVMSAILVSWV